MSLSKPRVRLRTTEPSFDGQQDDVDLAVLRLTVTAAIRSPDGDGAIDSASREVGLLLVGREIAAVVGRTLLVAERLEAFLQVALEVLVELVLLHLQRFFVSVLAAADDALAQREHELADAFLAELGLDELEHRVTEVVNQPRVVAGVAFELAHLRHDVGDRGVAHRHQVDRAPLAALVVRQSLVDPQRRAAANQSGCGMMSNSNWCVSSWTIRP